MTNCKGRERGVGRFMNLLLVRGTSWSNPWNWRLRELRGDHWHLLTTSEPLAEYHRTLTAAEAARLAHRQFPGSRIYMLVGDPNAQLRRCENIAVARVDRDAEVISNDRSNNNDV